LKAVVDTNVIAYHLLGDPSAADEVERFWLAADELVAPASWEVELGNVLWMAVRKRRVSAHAAESLLEEAGDFGVRSVSVQELWEDALRRATSSGVSFYDAVFVTLAERESAPLATFDAALLRVFPGVARRPGDIATP
jgi:predicted nucleic acid-binding protein